MLQDKLIGALIGLARATFGNEDLISPMTQRVLLEGLSATITNTTSNEDTILKLLKRIDAEKKKLVPDCYSCTVSCGRTDNYDMNNLWNTTDEETRSLKSLLLFSMGSIATYAYQATILGYRDDTINHFLYRALFSIGMDDYEKEDLLPILIEAGEISLKCRTLLNQAHTENSI